MIGRVTKRIVGTLVEVRVGNQLVEAVGRVKPGDWVELVAMSCFRVPVARPNFQTDEPAASSPAQPTPQERPSMSVFKRILSSPRAMSQPVPSEAVMASWLFSVLTLADATASGPDEFTSVPAEAERRLLAAGIPALVAEHVRRYATNLGL